MMQARQCVGCGCTDMRTCPGGCSWFSIEPPICTTCAERVRADDLQGDEGNCTVSKSGLHQALFRGDGSAYCVHCRDDLDVSEAA